MQSINGFQSILTTFFVGIILHGPLTGSPLLAQDDALNIQIPDEYSAESVNQQLQQLEDSPPMRELSRGMLVFLVIFGVFVFLLQLCLLVSNYTAAASIPVDFRQVNPIFVFLLLIPCLNLIMSFVVWIGIANGFKQTFESQGRTEFGNCGAGLALAAALCMIVVAPVGLVLWIIVTIRFNALKNEIVSGAQP